MGIRPIAVGKFDHRCEPAGGARGKQNAALLPSVRCCIYQLNTCRQIHVHKRSRMREHPKSFRKTVNAHVLNISSSGDRVCLRSTSWLSVECETHAKEFRLKKKREVKQLLNCASVCVCVCDACPLLSMTTSLLGGECSEAPSAFSHSSHRAWECQES